MSRPSRYVCPKCRAPGVVDPGFTLFDDRYATGKCSGIHEGKQVLVREDVEPTEKTKKPRPS